MGAGQHWPVVQAIADHGHPMASLLQLAQARQLVLGRAVALRHGDAGALRDALESFEPDWVVSAGFMRILGREVLSAFPLRVVNTHPALLPSFPGAHAVRDALAHGVRVTGSTIHLVDEGVDTGPIIDQRAVSVHDDDDEDSLHERIKVVERDLLVDVVRRLATWPLSVQP